MSTTGGESRRKAPKLCDFELLLRDTKGTVIDLHSRAQDVTMGGFRAETRVLLREGQDTGFEMILDHKQAVSGRARVVWVAIDSRGVYVVGFKIRRISWRDSRRLRAAISESAYDFVQLARNLFRTIYWIVVAIALHNITYHQPVTLSMITSLTPVAVALAVAAWAMLTLLR